jgi:DNA-binding transcriptional MocR family regulator
VLEHQLGISKNTVQAAYDELAARGLLVTRERDGVFVAQSTSYPPPPDRRAAPMPRLLAFSLKRQRLPEPSLIHLSMVFIYPELLPRERIAECFRAVLHEPGLQALFQSFDAELVGFVAGSPATVPALCAAKRVATLGNPSLIEATLAELLDREQRLLARKIHIELMPQSFYDGSQAGDGAGVRHLHGFPIGYAYLTTEKLTVALEVLAEELERFELGSAA